MARRLISIVALGSTLAVIGAGTASSLSVGGVDVTAPSLPLTTTTTSTPTTSNPLPDTQLPSLSGGGSSGSGGGSTSGGSSTSGGGSTSGGSSTSSGSTTTISGGGGTSGGGSGSTKSRRKGLFGKQKRKHQGSKQVIMDQKNKIT